VKRWVEIEQGFLFLSLVGAAIYAFLVYSHDALKDRKAEISSTGQAQSDHSAGNHFSSWDNYLPTPASESSQSASSQDRNHTDQDTERQVGEPLLSPRLSTFTLTKMPTRGCPAGVSTRFYRFYCHNWSQVRFLLVMK
jgi:hypothetical protein